MWKRQSSKSTQPALPCVVDPIDSAEKDVPTYRSVQDFVNRICIYQGRYAHINQRIVMHGTLCPD